MVLLLLASLASAHVCFLDFSSNGKATGVKFDTGYNLNAVQVVWEKYGRRLIRAVEFYKGFRVARSQGACALEDEVAAAFYCALWYMHQYPTMSDSLTVGCAQLQQLGSVCSRALGVQASARGT